MSNVAYDLDTSGGLMPLIKALIKPPDEDLNVQKPKKPQHPYYKRPGKGHNHDSCDACGEGGDLICCDRCPASFHLGCYDPPLDVNDIPSGLWLCRECCASDDAKPASSRSSRAQSPADNKSDNEKKTRSLRNNHTNSKKKSKDEEEDDKKEVEKESDLTPMEILVKAAKIMNPRQFELPREMRIPCNFPGTDKVCSETSKNGNGSLVNVDAWGCVPLPAKSCYVCRATCKHAPLLQCDYCPLLFHQDCLDPPLTALPTGRWMCPNHVEQYIDWKLVNSISATERVALWDKFSGPVDQHAIKINFIRRAKKYNPAFRIKVPVEMQSRVRVPAMVRYHYAHPGPLAPSRREYVRCVNALKNLKMTTGYVESEEEDAIGPKHKICMNLECPTYSGSGECSMKHDDNDTEPSVSSSKEEPRTASSSDTSDSDYDYDYLRVKRRKVCSGVNGAMAAGRSGGRTPSRLKRNRSDRLELRPDPDVEELLAVVDEQLKKLDDRLIKLLAWQQLQQVGAGEACWSRWRGMTVRGGTGGASARAGALALRWAERARRALRGDASPAVPLPSELLSRADRERIARTVWGAMAPPPPPPPPQSISPPASPGHSLSHAPVHATLCAIPSNDKCNTVVNNTSVVGVGSMGVGMRASSLSIGWDSACDVRLDPRLCINISRMHALIFKDEVSRHYELINYSEYGTRVNGVLYACDVSLADDNDAAAAVKGDTQTPETEQRVSALRDIVNQRDVITKKVNGNLTKPTEGEWSCSCSAHSMTESRGAWEGGALVPHGALLHFGCLSYVFSITEHTLMQTNEDPTLTINPVEESLGENK